MSAPRAPRVTASAPAAPPPAPKAPAKKKRKARRRSVYETFMQGETRGEMIAKYRRQGVSFSDADLALKVPALRKLAKERLAALQAPDGPDAA